jgi:hydrogenase maturation protease
MAVAPRILGIGNATRGDDGVGPYVLGRLRTRLKDASLRECSGDLSSLLEHFEDPRPLLLIDAADADASGLAPGTISRLDALGDDTGIERSLRSSTHAMGVGEAIALGRALGLLPASLQVIAIAGQQFSPGAPLSPPVVAAADRLVTQLVAAYGTPAPESASAGPARRPPDAGTRSSRSNSTDSIFPRE